MQIAAGANADGCPIVFALSDRKNFNMMESKEEKLACEDAVSKAISAHGLDDSGYLCKQNRK